MPYIYQADVWCDSCGESIKKKLGQPTDFDPSDETTYDSDEYPKVYNPETEESDSPQHCGAGEHCLEVEELPSGRKIGAFLGIALTANGAAYLLEQVADGGELAEFWLEHFPCVDPTGRLRWLGLDIEVTRSVDGILTVDIETSGLDSRDVEGEHEVPKLRLMINEQEIRTNEI